MDDVIKLGSSNVVDDGVGNVDGNIWWGHRHGWWSTSRCTARHIPTCMAVLALRAKRTTSCIIYKFIYTVTSSITPVSAASNYLTKEERPSTVLNTLPTTSVRAPLAFTLLKQLVGHLNGIGSRRPGHLLSLDLVVGVYQPPCMLDVA